MQRHSDNKQMLQRGPDSKMEKRLQQHLLPTGQFLDSFLDDFPSRILSFMNLNPCKQVLQQQLNPFSADRSDTCKCLFSQIIFQRKPCRNIHIFSEENQKVAFPYTIRTVL